MGNSEQTVVVGDRRLMSFTGGVASVAAEDRTKLTAFECRDGRGVFAFAGLAEATSFRADEWLLGALVEAARPDYGLAVTLNRLPELATARIAKVKNLNESERRLSIFFGGYAYPDDDRPRMIQAIISNFERVNRRLASGRSADDFWIDGSMQRDAEWTTEPAVVCGGEPGGCRAARVGRADQARGPGLRPCSRRAGVNVIRAASDRDGHATIGKDCLVAVVPSEASQGTILSHEPDQPTRIMAAANLVRAGGDDDWYAIRDMRIEPDDPSVVLMPKTGRNKPCPCGSGRKFKHCHGG
jgi:hypothetical protein